MFLVVKMVDIGTPQWYNCSMLDSKYKTSESCLHSLKYHFVWCPKYRKEVLVGRIEARLRELLYEIANNMGVEIEALEIMSDHVHICFC